MAITHRMIIEVITIFSWKRWKAQMIKGNARKSLLLIVYSIDFRDSAILIFSSLKYMRPFTSMAKRKVNKRLSR